MIDRDQLREALKKFDALPDDGVIVVKSFRTFPALEAARLVADPDTLVITKVDGEWALPAEMETPLCRHFPSMAKVMRQWLDGLHWNQKQADALLEGQK